MKKLMIFAALLSVTASAQVTEIDHSVEKYFVTSGVSYDRNTNGEIDDDEIFPFKEGVQGSFYIDFKTYGAAGTLLSFHWVLRNDSDTSSRHTVDDGRLLSVETDKGIHYIIEDKEGNRLILLMKTDKGYMVVFYELAMML